MERIIVIPAGKLEKDKTEEAARARLEKCAEELLPLPEGQNIGLYTIQSDVGRASANVVATVVRLTVNESPNIGWWGISSFLRGRWKNYDVIILVADGGESIAFKEMMLDFIHRNKRANTSITPLSDEAYSVKVIY